MGVDANELLSEGVHLISAAAVADSRAGIARAVLLEVGGAGCLVLARGSEAEVGSHPAARGAARVRLERSVVLPGLVNAHTHLDLTHIGPRPFDPSKGFVGFVDVVRSEREGTAEGIAASVARGVELSLRGGTAVVGDIAGAPGGMPSLVPHGVVAASGMRGVSFVEFFAIGKGERGGLAKAAAAMEGTEEKGAGRFRVGLQPHATNTVSVGGYRWAAGLAREKGLRLSTHLAETPEERQFIGSGRGPQRDLLERLGVWTDEMLEEIGRGKSPVVHLAEVLREAPFIVAHVNDCGDGDLEVLAASGATVAYCPRASAYFGQEGPFGAHRYREMLAAGIPVALGTDSIVNLPSSERISVLEEMRFLRRRDGVEASDLMRMATVNGAAGLGVEAGAVGLGVGDRPAGVIAVDVGGVEGWERDPLDAVMRGDAQPRWVYRGG